MVLTSVVYGLNMLLLAYGGGKLLLFHVVVVWCFKLFSQLFACSGHTDRGNISVV